MPIVIPVTVSAIHWTFHMYYIVIISCMLVCQLFHNSMGGITKGNNLKPSTLSIPLVSDILRRKWKKKHRKKVFNACISCKSPFDYKTILVSPTRSKEEIFKGINLTFSSSCFKINLSSDGDIVCLYLQKYLFHELLRLGPSSSALYLPLNGFRYTDFTAVPTIWLRVARLKFW